MTQRVITSARWLPTPLTGGSNISAIVNGVQMVVPVSPGNRDYQAIMDWVADGHVIDEHIVPPPAVPDIISDRQFFQQLALQGEITQDEALAYVQTGTLPARLSTALDQAKASGQMTDLEAFNAKMTIVGATEFRRSHSLVPMLAAIFSKSPAEIDQIWRDASLL